MGPHVTYFQLLSDASYSKKDWGQDGVGSIGNSFILDREGKWLAKRAVRMESSNKPTTETYLGRSEVETKQYIRTTKIRGTKARLS